MANYKKYASKAAPVTIEFSGVEELQQIFEKLPEKYAKKPVTATFRKGGNIYNKTLRQNLPPRMSQLKKLIKSKAGKGKSASLISGAWANMGTVTKSNGKEFDAFYILYWSNYGTLSNRQPGHKFDRARRAVSSSWGGGVRPQLFAEKAWEQSKDQVETVINDELENETLKFLNKYKVTE